VNSSTKWWLVTLATVLGVAATLYLGRWQLSRAAQKEAMQASMDTRAAQSVLRATDLLKAADVDALVHQRAALRGTWVAAHTVYLDNRQMNAKVGFFVMTPFALEGGGAMVVQRGWVPRNFEQRDQVPSVQTPGGVVEIEGRIAPPPSKLYEPGSPLGGAIRQNLDLAQYRAETGLALLPITLVQTGAASEGLLRVWPAVNLGVEKHYGYAFQWFGLAALIACLYLWFQVFRRMMSRPKESTRHVQ
jgi:surfeit locus 1 family protein